MQHGEGGGGSQDCITGVALGTVSVTGMGMAGGKAGFLTQKALGCTPWPTCWTLRSPE